MRYIYARKREVREKEKGARSKKERTGREKERERDWDDITKREKKLTQQKTDRQLSSKVYLDSQRCCAANRNRKSLSNVLNTHYRIRW